MERTNGAASEVERVTDLLRAEVLDGSRPPGSKLVERDLAEELGVSRVPVRDALKALAAEGLVTLRPRTWAVVSEFSAEDIADLTEVREALEGLAFRLAAQRRTEEGLTRLRAVVDDEAAAAHRDDAARARRSAAAFHEVVFDLAGNRLLSEVEALTRSRMRRFLGLHDDLVQVAQEHRGLYEAIAAGDVDAVERLSAAHLTSSTALREAHEASRRGGD
ncbi:MAG TPA: GntR family transcriptional regulator [Acidimicrobiales bacterium]|nr:GntR family transcriptional regulator [Acidimicrobiales bacterium]